MKNSQQKTAAKEFAHKWEGRGYEKGESQTFWLELLEKVLGVADPYAVISFENQVKLNNTSFIDAYIESTHTLIEQKSIDKDLRKPILQSDGSLLTPIAQAKRYALELPYSRRPRWMVMCNFRTFHVYDMENPQAEPEVIELANLEKEYYRLECLVKTGNEHLQKETEASVKAGELIGEIYDELLTQYINPNDPTTLRSLNILCVRLVFCLYAEDAGLFDKHSMFHDYLIQFKPGDGDMREGLIKLFEVLDTPIDRRSPYLKSSLKSFPYVNGGLFADKDVEVPLFNDKIAQLILRNASDGFDWSQISPTIFGAVFESTLNPETRRSGGMHYTSIENIHKVIDPLFLDDLKKELKDIKSDPIQRSRAKKAYDYQEKLAGLKFLDPACGSGNFLTETYLSLRRLENEAIQLQSKDGGPSLGVEFTPIKVDIHQFYGIEINDFAVSTATTALWIAESQMMAETEKIMQMDLDFLPLKSYHNIVEGNALRMDWNDVVPAGELSYIIGNPPFVGARFMSPKQKDDVLTVFGKDWPNVGNLDYVSCWYKKAVDFIGTTSARCAYVSTNSVSQGEHVANLWEPLMKQPYNIHIDFAWKTFVWDSEASLKAHVHCVIIGFSFALSHKPKILMESSGREIICSNINGYLLDCDNIAIKNRPHPICDVPEVGIGNKPIDGGFYLFTEEEMQSFIASEPASAPYFHPWYGAMEFINNKPRYCLWLGNCSPAELRKMPRCLERVDAVRKYRLASPSPGTIKIANKPTRFHVENMPKGNFIVIPQVSSQRRRYIPMGYMNDSVLCSDKVRIMPQGDLYHFGILESNVHMSWMRAICCRLKSDYSYTINDVYNNFPWPNPSDDQKAKIKQTSQRIIETRADFPDCSLADLYDETSMPSELRNAHQENDRAVMEAYGFDWRKMTESEIVAELLKMYQKLTIEQQ